MHLAPKVRCWAVGVMMGLPKCWAGQRSRVGWAAGVERLAMLVDAGPPPSQKVVVIAADSESDMAAFQLAEQLRDAGIDTDLPTAGAVGKKLKKADKAGIRLALILGSDERAKGTAQLRDLDTGTQSTILVDDRLAAVIADSLQAP